MVLELWPLVVLPVAVIATLFAAITFVYEYEYGLRFRFGRLVGPVEPGLQLRVPFAERIRTYTRRVVTVEVPPQSAMTLDNVSVDVSAVVYFRVTEPTRTVVAVQDHEYAVTQLAQSALRSTVGTTDLDDVLSDREGLADSIAATVEAVADDWGIDVIGVELREIEIPAGMQRVLAAQAEAQREKRARTRLAQAEAAAAETLTDAADRLADSPGAMALRRLQNRKEVAAEANATVLLPTAPPTADGGGATGVDTSLTASLGMLAGAGRSIAPGDNAEASAGNVDDIADRDTDPVDDGSKTAESEE